MFSRFTKRGFCQLKQKLESVIPKKLKEFKEVKDTYGNKKIGEITVGQVLGGMRGLTGLFYDTSKLDAQQVIFKIINRELCLETIIYSNYAINLNIKALKSQFQRL